MKIIYEDNGNVCVVHPSNNWTGTMEDLANKIVPKGLHYDIVDDNIIPSDRTFRNAWKTGATGVEVDMLKARELWREKIRQARISKFAENDTILQNAIADGDEKAKSVAITLRNKLRELPQDPRIDAAQTPNELKAIWFDELK